MDHKRTIEILNRYIRLAKSNPELFDLSKAKIIDFKTKQTLADLPSKDAVQTPSTPAASMKPAPAKNGDVGVNHPLYTFKVKGGYLVGKNLESKNQSPNAGDVEHWLKARNVHAERVHPNSLPTKEAHSLALQGDPHTTYEVDDSGLNAIALHNRIERKPGSTAEWIAPQHGKPENYAFTSTQSLKVNRYGSPNGNIWIAEARGDNGNVFHAAAKDKDEARRRAYHRESRGGTGNPGFMPSVGQTGSDNDGSLVVGSNQHLRERIPFFAIQRYDHHIFHKLTSQGHQAGIVALSRTNPDEPPMYIHANGKTSDEALDNVIHQAVIEHSKNLKDGDEPLPAKSVKNQHAKNIWLTHAIYRAPKRSLRDVLATGRKAG